MVLAALLLRLHDPMPTTETARDTPKDVQVSSSQTGVLHTGCSSHSWAPVPLGPTSGRP